MTLRLAPECFSYRPTTVPLQHSSNVPRDGAATPPLDLQRGFWDGWNAMHRTGAVDGYMARQAAVAADTARRVGARSFLEVGCGTGWLCGALAPLGDVTGLDLSPASIAEARRRYPGVRFIEGDFDQAPTGSYDLVVSADVISHVADQRRFVERLAGWTRPGGTLVLMTQNGFVWGRSSYLVPQAAGQIRSWPTMRRLRQLLRPWFVVRRTSSMVPGGDLGILRMVHSRWIGGVLRRTIGEARRDRLYERLYLGRELVLEAERRPLA